jgi:hypothetical protein
VRGYVVKETIRGREWWWFFTQPFRFSVYWQPDGTKTMEQFALEQAASVRAFIESSGGSDA